VSNVSPGNTLTETTSNPSIAGGDHRPLRQEEGYMVDERFRASVAPPRTIVTGGAGFLGSHLCDRLIAEGHEVVCIDSLLTGQMKNIQHLLDHPRFTFVLYDVTMPMDLEDLTRRAEGGLNRGRKSQTGLDYILHLASPASPKAYAAHPIHTLKLGSLGTYHALGMAKKYRSVFLLASTSEVYGDPEVTPQSEIYWGHVNPIGPRSVYDEAKRIAEAMTMAYAREHGVKVRIARIFNTYGERMRIDDGRALPNFLSQALKNLPVTVYGNGAQTRSFCHVSDLVEGLYRLLKSDQQGPINLGNPEEIALLRLAERVIERTNSQSKIIFEPLPVNDPIRRRPDISKAASALNWRPRVSLQQGIDRVIPYFRSQIEADYTTLLNTGQSLAG
jgi:dTDP-glucose 4,6-dehydratase